MVEVADVVEAEDADEVDEADEAKSLDEAAEAAVLEEAEEVAELVEADVAAAGAAAGVGAMTPSKSRKRTWRGIASKTSPFWRRLPAIFSALEIVLTTV